ncbi:hypothetical protein SAMN02927900_06144 [Rhizobium mongolense subsp. loessense]|uniref:Beta-ketoacyl synthase-like protein n=1 Tax=Rhizobium mongolense subsp. loessense TaxID=158890 RepID=A0A1G4U5A3_9HYPH|nr:hypothetical protein [Rhizobium mongolense]SCW88832.1 hypothetical protein SAMN02927900_06144 [Rhizobium mongolense subsp. loessense]
MTISLDPKRIVWNTFDGLEPPIAGWQDQVDYWEDYTSRFFRSNGKDYTRDDSNVARWLTASDRAPFANMLLALLPILRERADLCDLDLVILAHWLPDIHLGTSVTNLALHSLGIDDGLGFAVSDRGRSASLFALHCIGRYLANGRKKALLVTMDQKHLLYRSPIVEAANPFNAASMVVLSQGCEDPLHYRGYRRLPNQPCDTVETAAYRLAKRFDLDAANCILVADRHILPHVDWSGPVLPQEPRLLCSAPFAALADHSAEGRDYLLMNWETDGASGVYLSSERGDVL